MQRGCNGDATAKWVRDRTDCLITLLKPSRSLPAVPSNVRPLHTRHPPGAARPHHLLMSRALRHARWARCPGRQHAPQHENVTAAPATGSSPQSRFDPGGPRSLPDAHLLPHRWRIHHPSPRCRSSSSCQRPRGRYSPICYVGPSGLALQQACTRRQAHPPRMQRHRRDQHLQHGR